MSEFRSDWPNPPNEFSLAGGEVHVWGNVLDLPEKSVCELFDLLSEDERQRAMRFKFDHHRRRFIVCRGRQRLILSRYLNTAAEKIEFEYQALGKPYLSADWCHLGVRFNTSNSHELALVAIAIGRELGVDVEHIRPMQDMNALAMRYFAGDEQKALETIPQQQRLEAFFACWTRKEAILKALGTGLSMPLDKFVVSLTPDEPATLLSFDGDLFDGASCFLHTIRPAAGYIAALASPGEAAQVKCWMWDDRA